MKNNNIFRTFLLAVTLLMGVHQVKATVLYDNPSGSGSYGTISFPYGTFDNAQIGDKLVVTYDILPQQGWTPTYQLQLGNVATVTVTESGTYEFVLDDHFFQNINMTDPNNIASYLTPQWTTVYKVELVASGGSTPDAQKYTITYIVDGQTIKTELLKEGATPNPPADPIKENHVFTGWVNLPETMPAQDLVIYGYFVKDKAYTTISVGTTGYSTFCSTQALYFTGTEAIKAYIAKEKSATEVSLIQVIGAVAAGTGLVLKGGAGATASIETVETGNRYDDNLLKGVLGYNVSINSAYQYVLVNKNGTAKFADTAGNQAIVPIGKAYLEGPSSAGGRMLSLVFDDETTAISTPATQAKQNNTIYNMNGMRVQNPQRGLYIMNGKKVMIK